MRTRRSHAGKLRRRQCDRAAGCKEVTTLPPLRPRPLDSMHISSGHAGAPQLECSGSRGERHSDAHALSKRKGPAAQHHSACSPRSNLQELFGT